MTASNPLLTWNTRYVVLLGNTISPLKKKNSSTQVHGQTITKSEISEHSRNTCLESRPSILKHETIFPNGLGDKNSKTVKNDSNGSFLADEYFYFSWFGQTRSMLRRNNN